MPQLTPRHWDLLRLLATGHTNAQIARRLGISEGTVPVNPSGRCGTPETEPGPSGVVAADELMSIPFPETLRAFAAGRRTDNPL